jgi:multiple sugar transport system permease protein
LKKSDRRRLVLALCAFAALATALIAGLLVSQRSAFNAREDLLREETSMAAEVLRWASESSLTPIFGTRWSLTNEITTLFDEASVVRSAEGLTGIATVYDSESWNEIGTLSLRERPTEGKSLPRIVLVVGLLALIGLGILSCAAVRPGTSAIFLRWVFPPLAFLLMGIPLGMALVWTTNSLSQAGINRVHTAIQTLSAIPDLDSLITIPGGVAHVTGASFLLRNSDGSAEFSTLPSAATSDLSKVVFEGISLVTADRVEYLSADVGSVRLAFLPYTQTRTPIPTVIVLALLGVLLAVLPVALTGLVDQPRAFHRHVVAWSFLAPASLHLAIFTLGPLALAAWLSLHRWSLIDVARPFVGLANYARVLGDGAFWNAIRNTILFTLHVPVSMAIALALALIVQRKVRGIVFLRAMLFLPTITSLVAVAMVWQWMLHDEYGLFNWLLSKIGIAPVSWLSSPSTALLSIMIMATWMVVGYQMILFQAGLAAIPSELYDAARIDGANVWRRFVHVTIPGLKHTLFFVLVTSVIGSFQVFGAVYVMTEGGPLHSTDVAVFHIYQEAWEYFRFGDAAAMSWVLFAIIFAATWLQFRTLERRVEGQT